MEKKKRPVAKKKTMVELDEAVLFAIMDRWWETKVSPIRKVMEKKPRHRRPPIVRVPIDILARILFLVGDVFGRDAAVDWLCSPAFGLGGEIPVDVLEAKGEQQISDLLGRIEHGVYG